MNRQLMINKIQVKNRILMPPLVCFNWADEDGFETVSRAHHYGERAKGGSGLIVIEATAIMKSGRLAASELGLWKEEHIEQFRNTAEAIHKHDSVALVQLVHAGDKSVGDPVYSASAKAMERKNCLELTLDQIEEVKHAFVEASVRAFKAGLDGVEIHGAHGYLLSQFASSASNQRLDQYGGSLENRMRLSLEIVEAVRKATSPDFIIGYRYGVNDPTFKEDLVFVRNLEEAGVDLLNVSSGILTGEIEAPPSFDYSAITYMGSVIKKHARIPVACVFGIRYPEQAQDLLDKNHCDLVAIGRGILADPEWANKAISGKSVNVCFHCKPRCKYASDGNTCPWRVMESNN